VYWTIGSDYDKALLHVWFSHIFCDAEKHAMEVDSPIGIPKQFDEDEEATPFPRENQIFVAVENLDTEDISLGYGWSGSITYPDFNDGSLDTSSFEGVGSDGILMDCKPGQPYAVTFQKDSERGHLVVTIWGYEKYRPVIDTGETYASYGLVSLRGKC
jgi:hypothetical protein